MGDKIPKKKTMHFFETYIIKVLKQISYESGITSNAKQQLNSALCIIAKKIASVVIELVIVLKKKTITQKEVSNAISVLFTGQLLYNSTKEGEKSITTYQANLEEESKNSTKQDKACIIFPPSLAEKFLRKFGYYKVLVSNTAPIYLAAVLEYICFEILDISNMNCKDNKRVRINIRDIELAVRTDLELESLFKKLNISFLGGGVVPFIHPSLLNKTIKRPLKLNITNNRRFHSGTIALKNIKKQQKFSDSLIVSKSSFEYFVREIFKENKFDEKVKISKNVFIILQHFIEQYITDVLRNANYLAIHASRVKLTPVDIGLISFLNGKSKNPYHYDVLPEINEEDDAFSYNEDNTLSHVTSFSTNIDLLESSDENSI